MIKGSSCREPLLLAETTLPFDGNIRMDMEARVKAVEERLSDVETAQRHEGTAMQQMFELVKRIDTNMGPLVTLVAGLETRTAALETNFSLLNAKVASIDTRMGSLEVKMGSLETKTDTILELLRRPSGSTAH